MTLSPEFLLLAPVSLFVIVSPLSTAAIFVAMTPGNTPSERERMARLACLVAGGVLIVFALTGHFIFRALGIAVPAFQAAGGIILMIIALDLLRSHEGSAKISPEEKDEGTLKDDIAITPLGVPLLAGPGALSTVILLNDKAVNLLERGYLIGSIVVVLLVSYIVLRIAANGARWISPLLLRVSNRLMGLLLAAIAVQFVFNGVRELIVDAQKSAPVLSAPESR